MRVGIPEGILGGMLEEVETMDEGQTTAVCIAMIWYPDLAGEAFDKVIRQLNNLRRL